MTPEKVWSGQYYATGGYLVVKENGDILCYHIYNRNHFEDYLFNNTKLETASSKVTAPKKNAGGSISFLPTSCRFAKVSYFADKLSGWTNFEIRKGQNYIFNL